jgi:DNA polymerase
MAEDSRSIITRQVQQHLQALRNAGVEHLPVQKVPTLFEPVLPEVTADTPADRRLALQALAGQVAACSRCPELFSTRTQTVFGTGPMDAELCFVGEAPGFNEDKAGEPFVGDAGQLLTKIILAMGLKRESVYICNTIKCRPPQNRNPSPQECQNCRDYFEEQIALVRPKILCCLGAIAAKSILGTDKGITALRGKWFDYSGIPVMCTFHPAYLLRNPEAKRDCWEDMKAILIRMGRPIPGPAGR